MSEPFVTYQKMYTLHGLAEEDVKLLCRALENVSGYLVQPSLDRSVKLLDALKYVLPDPCSAVGEDDG